MKNNKSKWHWFFFKWSAAIIAAVGTISFFWAPFVAIAAWLAFNLSQSPVSQNLTTPMAVAWGVLTMLSLTVSAMVVRTRNRHVTVLTSIFTNRFCDQDGRRVRCKRRQIFRANRPGVTSYEIGMWPNFGGSTTLNSIIIQENGNRCTDDLITGSPTGGWDITHRFRGGLDFSIILALTPTWLIRKLCIEQQQGLPTVMRFHQFLRTLDVEYELLDEYNDVDLPCLQLQNTNEIRQRDIWFVIEFEDYPVDHDSVQGHIISDRNVTDLQRAQSSHEDRVYTFHVPLLVQDRVRISWQPIR